MDGDTLVSRKDSCKEPLATELAEDIITFLIAIKN